MTLENSESKFDAGQTLATGITSRLRAQITSGDIPPGEKLRLDDLRTIFGVSLSPLREALSRLSAEGFVVMEDQRGYRVAPVSEQNLLEVMKLRAEIETLALRESIRYGSEQWESEVVAALYRVNKLHRGEKAGQPPAASDVDARTARVEQWEVAHRALHQKLISACRMPLLLQFCGTLHDLSDRYRRLFLEDHPLDLGVSDEHARIVDAALGGRADEACAMMRAHIERTGTNLLDVLMKKQRPPAVPPALPAPAAAAARRGPSTAALPKAGGKAGRPARAAAAAAAAAKAQ